MPFDVGYVGGKYVAVRKLSDDPSPLFWEIVSIDGEAVDSRLEQEKGKYVGVQTETARKIVLVEELFHSHDDTYIKILYREPGGQEHTRKVRYLIPTNQKGKWEKIPAINQGACVYDGETMRMYQSGPIFVCKSVRFHNRHWKNFIKMSYLFCQQKVA